jgi:hypothetical protein
MPRPAENAMRPAGWGLLLAPTHSRESAKREEKPANWLSDPQTRSPSHQGKAKENYLKLNERCANLIENKGPL